MRIRFLSDQIFETGGPRKGPRFAAGFVLDEADVAAALGLDAVESDYAKGFLRRWVNRGVAEEVDRRTPTSAEKDAQDLAEQMAADQVEAKRLADEKVAAEKAAIEKAAADKAAADRAANEAAAEKAAAEKAKTEPRRGK